MKLIDLRLPLQSTLQRMYDIPKNKTVYVAENLEPYILEGGTKKFLHRVG